MQWYDTTMWHLIPVLSLVMSHYILCIPNIVFPFPYQINSARLSWRLLWYPTRIASIALHYLCIFLSLTLVLFIDRNNQTTRTINNYGLKDKYIYIYIYSIYGKSLDNVLISQWGWRSALCQITYELFFVNEKEVNNKIKNNVYMYPKYSI